MECDETVLTENVVEKKKKKFKKKFGDRYDGRRVKHGDPFNTIVPFLMKTRNDSQVLFDAEIDVSKIDTMLRERRKNGDEISFLEYFLAAVVRTISQYPRMNRFIAGRRLFARDDIQLSIAIKKDLSKDSEETTVKFTFDPYATVDDVSRELKKAIEDTKGDAGNVTNGTDRITSILNKLPRFLFSFAIGLIKFSDFYGIMPKALHRVSPFHTSVFVTNMGSIGAEPIYHHIYNFGTTSLFIAMGNRRIQRVIDRDGKISQRKVMRLRFVADERIADGYYLAIALKYFSNLFSKPELLEMPPEQVLYDDQV